MDFYTISKRGMLHSINQDYVSYKSIDEAYVVGLADGAGSKEFSREGAECVVEHILDYMIAHRDTLFMESKINICYNISCEIAYALNAFCTTHDNVKRDELGSTLMVVCVYRNSYIAIHLGDGLIGYITEDEGVKVLSCPQFGINHKYTYLTTSQELLKYVRVYKGHCNGDVGNVTDINTMFMMTDGFMDECYNWHKNKFQEKFVSDLVIKDYETIEYYITNRNVYDDSTMIVWDIGEDKRNG